MNETINPTESVQEPQPPSTAGMTTKVVKGSLWTMIGTIGPMLVSLFSTPFTIRFLGSEGYGVLLLIGLIPTYFGFADFGMGIASTRFGSEAYGKGRPQLEAEVARTAAFIALCFSLVFAIPIFIFSSYIVNQFNVPEAFEDVAGLGIKIASVSFVLGILGSVLNTPMLARLQMGQNSLVGAFPKILMAILTPVVLFFGGGIFGSVLVAFGAACAGLFGVIFFSGRLLPELYGLSINSKLLQPLAKFGLGLVVGGIAGILLVNFEKLALSRMVSVRSLAHYSVAFTFAMMASTFSAAMLQSLIPAFSQLLTPEKKSEFEMLFSRGMRINIIILLPTLTVLFVIAKPFLTFWAGPEFGLESTFALHILLLGLFFNILAYIPHSAITAKGRTDLFAKLYWVELVLYVGIVVVLINYLGMVGAAVAWSLRVMIDGVTIVWLSKRVVGVNYRFVSELRRFLAATLMLLPAMLFANFYDNFSNWLFLLLPLCISAYVAVIWHSVVQEDERVWIKNLITQIRQMVV